MRVTPYHLVSLVLSASTATASAKHLFSKRLDVSWGPIIGVEASTANIISTTSTIYPGKMPSDQKGYMFAWIGISNNTGDLIQSIVGSYPAGQSECSGSNADTTWCISSEVYGLDSSGATTQFVGDKRTADVNYENGIIFNYTLIDASTYLWEQTMTDAVTGDLLSTYQKISGPMDLWNTAVELQPYGDNEPTGTIEPQYYINTTITLDAADESLGSSLYTEYGGESTTPTTSDGGKTWHIEKITVPAMESSSNSSSSSTSSDSASATPAVVAAAADSSTSSAAAVVSAAVPTTSAVVAPVGASSFASSAAVPTEASDPWGSGGQGQDQSGGQPGGFGASW